MLSRIILIAAALLCTGPSLAQSTPPSPPASPGPATTVPRLSVAEAERAVRKIYATYFKRSRNAAMHERGWVELEPHIADSRVSPLLLELFGSARPELRESLVEAFVAQATDQADIVIAWVAVFDDEQSLREYAAGRLVERVGEDEPTVGVQTVLAEGLKSPEDTHAVAAAQLIRGFELLRAVPMLAQAQALPRNTVDDVRTGALAQIVVGTQQAFIQDLTPVVATNAVGFQPTVGVVSSGTVLRVLDATVWEYRTEIHRVLVEMTTAATGTSTARFGYDANAWIDWYTRELKPTLDAGGP